MIIGLIPARMNSRRLPGKNKRMFCGKPLVAWTIEAALKAGTIDRAYVSTDDRDIAAIAEDWGIPCLNRPDWLATDTATLYDVVRYHMRDELRDATAIMILQPTSPLRTADDIDECVRTPGLLYDIPRQSVAEGEAKANGAIYMAVTTQFKDRLFNFDTDPRVQSYPMPLNRSIDINTQEDFLRAENMMRFPHDEALWSAGAFWLAGGAST